jgi:uncharacterized protein (TIGR03435 family)
MPGAVTASVVGALYVSMLSVSAQQSGPSFEVASVRENTSGQSLMSLRWEPTGLRVVNTPLDIVLIFAFAIRQDAFIGLPGWARTTRYDITASLSDVKSRPDLERRTALQNLLRDRFKLVIRPATRETDTYSLVKVHDDLGPSMRVSDGTCDAAQPKSQESTCLSRTDRAKGELTGRAMTTDDLAQMLRLVVGMPVMNRTSLAGRYDVSLRWAPEVGGVSLQPIEGASIFTAVEEQLGLRLVPAKAPGDAFIVERLERPEPN